MITENLRNGCNVEALVVSFSSMLKLFIMEIHMAPIFRSEDHLLEESISWK